MSLPLVSAALLVAVLQSGAQQADSSLPARVKSFYDCYVSGHFRQADELVAPESKDAFFDSAKNRFRSYDVSRIDVSDGGNTADVVLVVDTDFQFGGRAVPIKMPMVAHWKKVNNAWYWFAPVRDVSPLPFGTATSDTRSEKPKASENASRPQPYLPGSRQQPVLTALLDKPVLTLIPGKLDQDVTHLRNTSALPFQFHINFDPVADMTLAPLEGTVNPGEAVTLRASMSKATTVTARTTHAGYIVIRSGIRLQFYVAIESQSAASATDNPRRPEEMSTLVR